MHNVRPDTADSGSSTGKWQKAMVSEYVLSDVEAKALAGASVAGVMTVGKDPEYGMQVAITGSTPNAAGFMHRGYGEAEETGSINFEELGKKINETIDGFIDAAAENMSHTAPNTTGKGSNPSARNSLSPWEFTKRRRYSD